MDNGYLPIFSLFLPTKNSPFYIINRKGDIHEKFLSLVTAIVMTVSLCIMPVYAQTYEEAAADAQNAEINYNRSVPLVVKGNKIVKQGTDEW